MKINWKAAVVLMVIVVAIGWTVNSIRSHSYRGDDLNFSIGSGPITLTNPSMESIPVQLVGTRTRSFSVSSTTEGISGSSTREGTGANTTNVFDFDLPPGVSEFTVVRGSDVKFVADTATSLEATVHAANIGTKIGILIAFLLAAIFYIAYITGWINTLLGRERSGLHSVPYTGEQDMKMRAYGDNRGK